MNEDLKVTSDLKERAQRAQKELFNAVLELYKMNEGVCFGAKKASDRLGLKAGHKFFFVDNILRMIPLEKCQDEKGYKYKQAT